MGCPDFLQTLGLCDKSESSKTSSFPKLWQDAQQDLGKALKQAGQKAEESRIDPNDFGRKIEQAGKGLEELINRGIDRLTKVDAADLEKSFKDSQDTLDPNKDGFVTREEIEKASQNPFFSLTHAHMLAVLKTHYEVLQTLSNDEWGFENSGITVKDIEAAHELAQDGLGLGTLTRAATGSAFSSEALTTAGILSAGGIAASVGSKLIFGTATRVPAIAGLGLVAGVIGLSGGIGALRYQFSDKAKLEALLSDLR